MKILSVIAMSVLLTNCAGNYKIKSEKGNVVDKVPSWYMADINDSKACDKKIFGKDKNKVWIYGVGTAVSPDLNLAIEKAKMLAKADLADFIKGEMNKESKQFINLMVLEPDEKITLEVYKQDEMPIYITFDDVVYNSVDDNIIEVTICI